jgi:CheY-specific phosphatase CheX
MIDLDSLFATLKDSARNVIKTMSGLDVVPGDAMTPDKNPHISYVSGNIGMTGEMKLTITVGFSEELITKIYSAVFPDEASQVTVFHMGDFVGELTNMISGGLRSTLAGLDMKFDSALPTVVIGSQQIYHPSGTIAKVIPFDVQGDTMFIEVGIKAL